MSTVPSRTANTSSPSFTCHLYGWSVQCRRTVVPPMFAMSSAPQARAAVNSLLRITLIVNLFEPYRTSRWSAQSGPSPKQDRRPGIHVIAATPPAPLLGKPRRNRGRRNEGRSTRLHSVQRLIIANRRACFMARHALLESCPALAVVRQRGARTAPETNKKSFAPRRCVASSRPRSSKRAIRRDCCVDASRERFWRKGQSHRNGCGLSIIKAIVARCDGSCELIHRTRGAMLAFITCRRLNSAVVDSGGAGAGQEPMPG